MVNNKYIPVVCHGDGLSVERHQDAQRARAASQTEEGRLKGLVPTPQEFHKRCIILQDTMTTLMEASGTSRGSALNIKAIFNHRNVARDVAKCFNHAVDFLEFMTHGYVTLMAMHLTGLDDMDQVPEQSPYRESLETRTSYLYTLARSIVDTTFPESKTGAELEDDQEFGDGYPFCTCKTATDEQMVRCSNTFCTNGTWFHLSCKSIALLPDGDWYCSEDCAESNLSIFCTCKRTITGATMIKCSNGSCKTGWFHVNCKNVAAADIDGEWYCSLGCRTTRPPVEQHEERDHKWEYTKSVIHRGLYDLSHRAMIRENDGKGLMTMWKLDMLEFYRRKHPKYLILGHILLTDISGFQTMRVAHDMVWNRTVNITGGKHRNIPMDLANEFLNREFKEKLKHAHGRYTTQDVRRKSVMVGPLENVICEKFHATTHTKTATSTNVKKVNVAKFVKEYHHDKLCQHIPNRPGHKHMELYINQQEIDNPTKLFQKLKKYAQKRDMRKEIMNR